MFWSISACHVDAGSTEEKSVFVCVGLWLLENRIVPESIIAFLDSDSFMDAIKNAISLGGDANTMACIAGGIAQAWSTKLI